MDKIVDFASFASKRQTAEDVYPVLIPEYALPGSALLMEAITQLDLITLYAQQDLIDGNVRGIKVQRLINVLKFLFHGISLPFMIHSNFLTRNIPGDDTPTSLSIYGWVSTMPTPDKLIDPKSFNPEFKIEVGIMEFEREEDIVKNMICDDSKMIFPVKEISERVPRSIIKAMNNLVRINSGVGYQTYGGYFVSIPYSGKFGLYVFATLIDPITSSDDT